MKRIMRTVAVLLIMGALTVPTLEARGRKEYQPAGQPTAPSQPANRPGQRPGQQPGQRPGQQPGQRPGQQPGQRPGQQPGHGQPNVGQRPPQGPPPATHPGRPGGQMHPNMPPPRPFTRPTPPPPSYRPYAGWPTFRSILGVTFGTALNLSINALIGAGHVITGYGSDVIYLNNVPMLGMSWPYVSMHYINGGLAGSTFTYATEYPDMTRYNVAYNTLAASYGLPYSSQPISGGIMSSWYGPDGNFITLSYQSGYSNNGYLRYYTTLNFGR